MPLVSGFGSCAKASVTSRQQSCNLANRRFVFVFCRCTRLQYSPDAFRKSRSYCVTNILRKEVVPHDDAPCDSLCRWHCHLVLVRFVIGRQVEGRRFVICIVSILTTVRCRTSLARLKWNKSSCKALSYCHLLFGIVAVVVVRLGNGIGSDRRLRITVIMFFAVFKRVRWLH